MAFYDDFVERLSALKQFTPAEMKKLAGAKLSDIVLQEIARSRQRIEDVRVAIGAVGPVPERLSEVEDQLTGQAPSPALLRAAASQVAERVRSRSRQAYRREVLVNFVERGLVAALADAGLAVDRLPKEMDHV